jgi:hypothetical protein
MKFFYNNLEAKEREEVALEKWIWGVVYKDNTELKQFEINREDLENCVFHRIGEVKQEQVALFVLFSTETPRRIDMIIPEGAKLVHKYKNYVFNSGTEAEKRSRIYVIGWKIGNNGFFNFVLPNGTIIQSINENQILSEFGLQ